MKRIALLTTGGTIAGRAASSSDTTGYTAGALGVGELLAAVPEIGALAEIVPEALYAIDSKDVSPAHWLLLAHRTEALLADPAIDGVVITHGTDTLEESAYFLHLTLATGKPVVFTGAMRPASALSADGPMNLYQAIAVAASGITRDCGVVVAMNDEIHAARAVSKTHTLAVSALNSPNGGPIGRSDPPVLHARPTARDAEWFPLAALKHTEPLPEVAIVSVAGGADPVFLQVVALHCAGIVLALPGHGSVPAHWQTTIDQLLQNGQPIVRASRTGAGPVSSNHDATLWASGDLSPSKARIALILALASGDGQRFASAAAQ